MSFNSNLFQKKRFLCRDVVAAKPARLPLSLTVWSVVRLNTISFGRLHFAASHRRPHRITHRQHPHLLLLPELSIALLVLVYHTLLSTQYCNRKLCLCCVSIGSRGYRQHGSPSFLRFCGTHCASQFCGSSTDGGRWPLLPHGARQPQLLVHTRVPRSVSFGV